MPRVNIPGISGRSFRFSRASFALPCPARTGNTSVCPVRAELRYDEICSAIIKNRFRFRCDTFRIFPERCERGRTRVLPIRPVLHDARNLPAPIVSVIIGLPLPVFATACILLPVACPPLQLARRSSLPAAPACPPLCPPFCLLCLLCLLCRSAALPLCLLQSACLQKKRDFEKSRFFIIRFGPSSAPPRLSARQSRKPSRTSCSRILAQSATGCFSPSMNRSGHPRLQSSM